MRAGAVVAWAVVVLGAGSAHGATTLYLQDAASDVAGYQTLTTIGSSTANGYVDTEHGVPSAEIQMRTAINGGGVPLAWLSCPLEAVDFSGGAPKAFNVYAFEADANVNLGLRARLYRYRGGSLDQFLVSAKGSELPTSLAEQSWTTTATTSSTNAAFIDGDRLALQLYATQYGGTSRDRADPDVTMAYSGGAGTADARISFSSLTLSCLPTATPTPTATSTAPTATPTPTVTSTAPGIPPGDLMPWRFRHNGADPPQPWYAPLFDPAGGLFAWRPVATPAVATPTSTAPTATPTPTDHDAYFLIQTVASDSAGFNTTTLYQNWMGAPDASSDARSVEASRLDVVPADVSCDRLRVCTNDEFLATTEDLTVTVRKSGSDTTLTCTVDGGTLSGGACPTDGTDNNRGCGVDLGTAVSFSAGDTASVSFTCAGAGCPVATSTNVSVTTRCYTTLSILGGGGSGSASIAFDTTNDGVDDVTAGMRVSCDGASMSCTTEGGNELVIRQATPTATVTPTPTVTLTPTPQETPFVRLAGDTMTGDLTLDDGTSISPVIAFQSTAGAAMTLSKTLTELTVATGGGAADATLNLSNTGGAGVFDVTTDGDLSARGVTITNALGGIVHPTGASGMVLGYYLGIYQPLFAAGDVLGDTTAGFLNLTIQANAVEESMLKAVDAAADEECLTYESTTGDFEWQACASGGALLLDAGGATQTVLDPVIFSDASPLFIGDGTAFSSGALVFQSSTGVNLSVQKIATDLSFGCAGGATDCTVTYANTGGTGVFNQTLDGKTTTATLEVTSGNIVLPLGAAGWFLCHDGTASFTECQMSGDATIAAGGALTIAADAIEESMLKAVNSPTDEYALTYEATTGDFEWQAMPAVVTPTPTPTATGVTPTPTPTATPIPPYQTSLSADEGITAGGEEIFDLDAALTVAGTYSLTAIIYYFQNGSASGDPDIYINQGTNGTLHIFGVECTSNDAFRRVAWSKTSGTGGSIACAGSGASHVGILTVTATITASAATSGAGILGRAAHVDSWEAQIGSWVHVAKQ